jgi:energy-coupling factor transporter ATP-binding protein EcfA2
MTRLIESPRRNGKSTLLKRMSGVDPSAKGLIQDVFKDQPKKFKWAVVDLYGKARLFINKPRLISDPKDHGKPFWYASHMAKKDTAEFRKKYARGIVVGEGYLCQIYIKSEHECILRREVA